MTRCVEKLNLFVRKTNTRQFYNLTDGRFRGFQMSTSFCLSASELLFDYCLNHLESINNLLVCPVN